MSRAIHPYYKHCYKSCFIALLLAVGLLFSSSAFAKDSLLDIQTVTSDSGITAWLVEDHNVPVIAMEFSFRGAGAVQDGAARQGLVRMLSNTMDEGAGDLNAQRFQKALQDLSISLKFNASRDHFGGSLKTLTKNKTQAFELLELALIQPRFDDEAVVRMRNANQSRIRSSLGDPDWIAARILNDVAFFGHAYALNSGGTLGTLDTITAQDLRDYHAAHLGRNNLVVAVAGDITADALKDTLDRVFDDLPDVEISSIADLELQNQGGVHIYEKDIPQTVIQMMQPGIDRQDPDYQIAQVMNFILGSSGFGSRLTEEIREKRGLTYGIYSYFQGLDHLDTLAVSTSTKNEAVEEMLGLITAEFHKLIETPITAQELDDAKAYLIGSLPLSLTATDKIARLLLSLQLDDLPADYLDQRETGIRAATIADVQRVARRVLSPESFVTIMVGKPVGDFDATLFTDIPNAE